VSRFRGEETRDRTEDWGLCKWRIKNVEFRIEKIRTRDWGLCKWRIKNVEFRIEKIRTRD